MEFSIPNKTSGFTPVPLFTNTFLWEILHRDNPGSTYSSFTYLAVLAADDYISVQCHVYFQQSEVFRPTSSIELWSELDVDMDTLCGGTENTHTLPQ